MLFFLPVMHLVFNIIQRSFFYGSLINVIKYESDKTSEDFLDGLISNLDHVLKQMEMKKKRIRS